MAGLLEGSVTRACLTCVVLLAAALNVPQAGQTPAPAGKPLVPSAASSIAANPEAFYGQTVSVTAAVDRVISPTAFTVDQDARKPATGEILVLVDVLSAPVAVNTYVTVIGEVVRHEGRPAIRARSVLDAGMVDLAKRPPPPLTPEEQAFDAVMKRINPAFGAIRQLVTAAGGEDARAHASVLRQGFTDTEAFWKRRDKPDAVKWAAEARGFAASLETAIATKQWDDAKTAVTGLQQTCSACHRVYRQIGDDGAYRIR